MSPALIKGNRKTALINGLCLLLGYFCAVAAGLVGVLVTLMIIRYRIWQWQIFIVAGACYPFFGIVLLQLLTNAQFFARDIYTFSLMLIPTGIIAALVYRVIGFRRIMVAGT